jgi:hypothetical protein
MPEVQLPSELDGCHALALPAGEDVHALAVAWFATSAWEVYPIDAEQGEVDRRSRTQEQSPRPGRLRLTARAALTGPWRIPADSARGLGLPDRDLDLFALDPRLADPLVLGWMTAAARRAGGGVLSADRRQAIVPDPASAVDLTLWSGTAVPSGELVAAVRSVLAGARMRPVEQLSGGGYAVTARFEYDGALALTVQPRDAVPVAVAASAWGDQGPWTYQVSWVPPDASELTVEQPSRPHLIARSRVTPVVARAARTMQQVAGGVVVDDGGFPVTADDLTRRAATL